MWRGHWLCGHPIPAESHREGDCYHGVSAHSSNPAWTAKGEAAPSCATSHTQLRAQALLPMHAAICLLIPLCLPWQLPRSPHFPSTNTVALLKHPCSRSCRSCQYCPSDGLPGGAQDRSAGRSSALLWEGGEAVDVSVHSPALLSWEGRRDPKSVMGHRGNGLIPYPPRDDQAHCTACHWPAKGQNCAMLGIKGILQTRVT